MYLYYNVYQIDGTRITCLIPGVKTKLQDSAWPQNEMNREIKNQKADIFLQFII